MRHYSQHSQGCLDCLAHCAVFDAPEVRRAVDEAQVRKQVDQKKGEAKREAKAKRKSWGERSHNSMQWKEPLNTIGVVPGSRRGHTMTALNSSTLVLFGGESDNDDLLNDMHTFDMITSTWRKVNYAPGPVPPPRYRHTATAIHSTAIVVIGGEMRNDKADKPRSDSEGFSENQIDVWIFDLRNHLWIEVKSKADDLNVPFARAGHSALFIKVPGQPPGIYLFGGLGARNFSAVVHRLGTSDWKWERVTVLTSSISGATVPTIDPFAHRKQEIASAKSRQNQQPNATQNGVLKEVQPEHSYPPVSCPCQRESHVAVWVNSLQSMVIFGGEMDEKFHSDFWAFSPVPGKANTWCWRLLRMKTVGNISTNKVPALSAASGILIPSGRPQLLIWAGILSPVSLNMLRNAWVVDLFDLKSFQIEVEGVTPNVGRLMHSLVLIETKLLLCGGVDADSDSDCGLQVIQLDAKLTGCCSNANDFGDEAAKIASKSCARDKGDDDGSNIKVLEQERGKVEEQLQDRPDELLLNSTFSGRVTLSSEHGTIVSIMIQDRPYKGILIRCPTDETNEESSLESKHCAEQTPQSEKDPVKVNDNDDDGHTKEADSAKGPNNTKDATVETVPDASTKEIDISTAESAEKTAESLSNGSKLSSSNSTSDNLKASAEIRSKDSQKTGGTTYTAPAPPSAVGTKRRLAPKLNLQTTPIAAPTSTLSRSPRPPSPSPVPAATSPTSATVPTSATAPSSAAANQEAEQEERIRAEKRRKRDAMAESLQDADDLAREKSRPFNDDEVICVDD